MMENVRAVDIIIPTYRPDKKVVELVRTLLSQSYPVGNIYIIDTKSGVFPQELYHLSENVHIKHIEPKEFDHGGTRHLGAKLSNAEILVYMTQDAIPKDEFLIAYLLEAFQEEDVAAAYARQLPLEDCHLLEKITRDFNYPEQSRFKSKEDLSTLGIKTYFCSNVCAAYRRSVYDELGGFEKKTIFNEDMIMAARMIQKGYRIYYAAKAQVSHSHNYSGIQQFHRNFDLAVSQADHPEIFDDVPSEGEGLRLVKTTLLSLLRKKEFTSIPEFIYKTGCKYLGYQLGKHYKQLPKGIIMRCTMNPRYWQ